MPVERACAQPGVLEHRGDAESPDPLLPNGFRRRSDDGAAHVGVGSELVTPRWHPMPHVCLPSCERIPLFRHRQSN